MKSPITAEPVARYVVEKITTDSGVEDRLRRETMKLPNAGMISGSDVGAFLAILVQSVQGKKAIEIGTFTGYTALKIASGLPKGGRLVCCDISEEWASIGRPFWKEAGVSDRIDLRIAPALATLEGLLSSGEKESFDFAFIDADKTGYDSYYEACLKLLRPGGLIALDNMLWSGRVADPSNQDESTVAIRKLNEKISKDPRVSACLITIGDGVMLARKN
ncbi:MAG: class I SAM-dependent methyltransferase [Bdellovibrionota bacterium]